ncbi:MAG: hypothetical protein GEU80_10255 [Dehalococcoidia bacterium]|nr:hypothetical protein [Dehalococcoidia bacterium]
MAARGALIKRRSEIEGQVHGLLEELAGLLPPGAEIPVFKRDLGGEEMSRDIAREIFNERRLKFLAEALLTVAEVTGWPEYHPEAGAAPGAAAQVVGPEQADAHEDCDAAAC